MSYDAWKTTDRDGDAQAGRDRAEDLAREAAIERAEHEQAIRDAIDALGVQTVREVIAEYVEVPIALPLIDVTDIECPF